MMRISLITSIILFVFMIGETTGRSVQGALPDKTTSGRLTDNLALFMRFIEKIAREGKLEKQVYLKLKYIIGELQKENALNQNKTTKYDDKCYAVIVGIPVLLVFVVVGIGLATAGMLGRKINHARTEVTEQEFSNEDKIMALPPSYSSLAIDRAEYTTQQTREDIGSQTEQTSSVECSSQCQVRTTDVGAQCNNRYTVELRDFGV
ncbi:uncharacterized protein LOC141900144 [Tubulanus polymorphus]|uniref:uncharacterized protein LOC141900144 n=1 Tax=Tubulanus polymorphus TaxID=672921 RepID=UPI003DA3058E